CRLPSRRRAWLLGSVARFCSSELRSWSSGSWPSWRVISRRADAVAYILPLFVYGLGQGNLQAPLVNFILADVPPQEAGSASGVVTTVQQLSFALGVAVIGGVFAVSLRPDPAAATYGEAFVH